MQLFIQPHCYFACYSWFPKLSMSLKTKLQTPQNSFIRCCLGQKDRSHIGKSKFEKINWLTVSNRVGKCLAVTAYNFKNALSPKYMGDIYSLPIFSKIRTCWSTYSFVVPSYKKDVPSYKKEIARKSIFYLGSKIWNNLNQDIKAPPGADSFKHDSMFLSCHVRFSE